MADKLANLDAIKIAIRNRIWHRANYRGGCINPAHLRIGTQLENVRDCVAKGRFV